VIRASPMTFPTFLRSQRVHDFLFSFSTPFVLRPRYRWFHEAFLDLITFHYPGLLCSLLLFWMIYGVGVLLCGKTPVAGFLQKDYCIAFLSSTSEMSDIGTLCVRVHSSASRVDSLTRTLFIVRISHFWFRTSFFSRFSFKKLRNSLRLSLFPVIFVKFGSGSWIRLFSIAKIWIHFMCPLALFCFEPSVVSRVIFHIVTFPTLFPVISRRICLRLYFAVFSLPLLQFANLVVAFQ